MTHMSPPDENKRRLFLALGIVLIFVSCFLFVASLAPVFLSRGGYGVSLLTDLLKPLGLSSPPSSGAATAMPPATREIQQGPAVVPTATTTPIVVFLPTLDVAGRTPSSTAAAPTPTLAPSWTPTLIATPTSSPPTATTVRTAAPSATPTLGPTATLTRATGLQPSATPTRLPSLIRPTLVRRPTPLPSATARKP